MSSLADTSKSNVSGCFLIPRSDNGMEILLLYNQERMINLVSRLSSSRNPLLTCNASALCLKRDPFPSLHLQTSRIDQETFFSAHWLHIRWMDMLIRTSFPLAQDLADMFENEDISFVIVRLFFSGERNLFCFLFFLSEMEICFSFFTKQNKGEKQVYYYRQHIFVYSMLSGYLSICLSIYLLHYTTFSCFLLHSLAKWSIYS